MATELQHYSPQDLDLMAKRAADSRLFPGIDTPQAAFALMMICQAEGLHPAMALRRYHIIKGRPSMKSEAMLAEFQARGGRVRWLRSDATECRAVFAHPEQAPDGVEYAWTIEQAKAAGLLANDTWRKYPDAMLRARVISNAIRMVLPGVVMGIYTPEEVQDMEPIDVTPAPDVLPPRARGLSKAEAAERARQKKALPAGQVVNPTTPEERAAGGERGLTKQELQDRARLEWPYWRFLTTIHGEAIDHLKQWVEQEGYEPLSEKGEKEALNLFQLNRHLLNALYEAGIEGATDPATCKNNRAVTEAMDAAWQSHAPAILAEARAYLWQKTKVAKQDIEAAAFGFDQGEADDRGEGEPAGVAAEAGDEPAGREPGSDDDL